MEELVALLRQPSILIGNDTGPMHFSAAIGNRVLAIFGPTSPTHSGPVPFIKKHACIVLAPGEDLLSLTSDKVFAELQAFLHPSPPRPTSESTAC